MEDIPKICQFGAFLTTEEEKKNHLCRFSETKAGEEDRLLNPNLLEPYKCPICGKQIEEYEQDNHFMTCHGRP